MGKFLFFVMAWNLPTIVLAIESPLICSSSIIEQTNAQYIFLGEDHRDNLPVSFLQTTLPILKEQGFSVFFAEYIDSADQLLLDEILSLNSQNKSDLHNLYEDFGYEHAKYIKITNTVLRNDFELKALDRRKDIRNIFPGDKKLAFRDQHMFSVAIDYITKNPNKKIIFLNGSSHSHVNTNQQGPSFYQLFQTYVNDEKILNIKFDYFDGLDTSPQRLRLFRIDSEKINLGCPSGSFMLNDSQPSSFDHYIFKDNEKAFPQYSTSGSYQI